MTIKATIKDKMGTDLNIVNAARVSFGKESTHFKEQDAKLIQYLAKHGHYSPFGHVFASFHVTAPIFVARQLVKHKFLRWNEISGRYVTFDPTFHTPEEFRSKTKDKKQGSGEAIEGLKADNLTSLYQESCMASYEAYKEALDRGVCEEQARGLLPTSLNTEWYWSGSLDAFANMCKLRCKDDTQRETREVADQVSEQLKLYYPVSWEALMAYGD